MIRHHRGLIVEVTGNAVLSAGGNPVTQTVKLALKGLALNMAAELKPHCLAAVAITPGFLRSETMLERWGQLFSSWELGREYRFVDVDGRRPDWGSIEIDFSNHPQALLQQMRIGSEIQFRWLNDLTRRTKRFLTKLPQTNAAKRRTRTRWGIDHE
jgi:NAD(P)-dependent dehydrogenase (short-subunit alcohol dehydrogenase family)